MNSIPERLTALRERMEALGLTHYLVPSADENINEYLPAWRERRQWASGFTGSAGDLLVGLKPEETWLFTDGRYHLQAERELDGSGIGLQKVGAKDGKSLGKVLAELADEQGEACVVGYDPMVLPISTAEALEKTLTRRKALLKGVADNLVDQLWSDRPEPPRTELIKCPVEWTGASVADKLKQLREDLGKADADALVAVRLDQIAWLLNLRSLDDIPYNPVFESYLYVDTDSVQLFLNGPEQRLPAGHTADIAGFSAHALDRFRPFLAELGEHTVHIDPDRVTAGVLQALEDNSRVKVARGASPIENRKAIKNDTELEKMSHANLMASVAKTRALLWLQEQLASEQTVTERSFLEHLEARYAEIDGYRGLSFNTISSTGEHGAIIHYSAADGTELKSGDLFLIDSGIQMNGGTTDDTRTVVVGKATAEQRRIYTLVLKGHVRAASQRFPAGTPGAALDTVTRSPLWSEGLNYDHGTGHGVGAFLNVHEGPFGIAERARRSYAALPLEPGMVTSIEPGYYEPAFGGVRIENLYHVSSRGKDGNDREWLEFSPLTYVPLDLTLIDPELLDRREVDWIDRYHLECMKRLEPHLTAEENRRLAGSLARLGDTGSNGSS